MQHLDPLHPLSSMLVLDWNYSIFLVFEKGGRGRGGGLRMKPRAKSEFEELPSTSALHKYHTKVRLSTFTASTLLNLTSCAY